MSMDLIIRTISYYPLKCPLSMCSKINYTITKTLLILIFFQFAIENWMPATDSFSDIDFVQENFIFFFFFGKL